MTPFIRAVVLSTVALAAAPAWAGPETLLSCADGSPPPVGWSVPGASVVCHQTVGGAGLDPTLFGRNSEQMAAFQANTLIAIRPGDGAHAAPPDTPNFQTGDWSETGSTGVPGELWWGRTATRQVFLGQESHVRLTRLGGLTPAQIPALRDFSMRRTMSLLHRQPMVYKPGDEPFMLFQQARIVYTQHAATTADFVGGLGGDGQIRSARATNARLELQTRPVIKGVLRFDLAVDGQTRQLAIPLRADSELDHLRARVSGDDAAPACRGDDAFVNADQNTCIVASAVTMGVGGTIKEYYDASGAFFGDHAAWVAIQYRMIVNSPSRNRAGAIGRGVIILKAQ